MWERGYCQPVPTMYDTHNSINYSNHSLKRGQPRIKQFTILFDALSSLSNKRAPLEIQAQTKSIKKLELCSRPSSSCNYVPTKKEKLHYHTLTHTHHKNCRHEQIQCTKFLFSWTINVHALETKHLDHKECIWLYESCMKFAGCL